MSDGEFVGKIRDIQTDLRALVGADRERREKFWARYPTPAERLRAALDNWHIGGLLSGGVAYSQADLAFDISAVLNSRTEGEGS